MKDYLVTVDEPGDFPVSLRVKARNKQHAVLLAGAALAHQGNFVSLADVTLITVERLKRGD